MSLIVGMVVGGFAMTVITGVVWKKHHRDTTERLVGIVLQVEREKRLLEGRSAACAPSRPVEISDIIRLHGFGRKNAVEDELYRLAVAAFGEEKVLRGDWPPHPDDIGEMALMLESMRLRTERAKGARASGPPTPPSESWRRATRGVRRFSPWRGARRRRSCGRDRQGGGRGRGRK